MLNSTHDPSLRSWVASANKTGTDFPLQNLPYAMVRPKGSDESFRAAVAIGDYALDLRRLHKTASISSVELDACQADSLNPLMSLAPENWSKLRILLKDLLVAGSTHKEAARTCLLPLHDIEYDVPAHIGDYTDFYASIEHATNIGRLFRPDNPLLPNYQWVPIAYHGRSSSIQVTPHSFNRPVGQLKHADQDVPSVEPCQRLDYELEVGIFVGNTTVSGVPIPISKAHEHIFGICLLNDWSARDVQAWEYQPLGPFLAKNFATTISPWIVTYEALTPFRVPFKRDLQHLQPLPYLTSDHNKRNGALDLVLQAFLQTEQMQGLNIAPVCLSETNFRHAFWTIAQMITHHTMNGCSLMPGDLLGSGTMSGTTPGSQGALLEITTGGQHPVQLPHGENRAFLNDGDTIILKAQANIPGAVPIGFGESRGMILPAHRPEG